MVTKMDPLPQNAGSGSEHAAYQVGSRRLGIDSVCYSRARPNLPTRKGEKIESIAISAGGVEPGKLFRVDPATIYSRHEWWSSVVPHGVR